MSYLDGLISREFRWKSVLLKLLPINFLAEFSVAEAFGVYDVGSYNGATQLVSNAAVTLTAASPGVIVHTAVLTATRDVTLPTASSAGRRRFRIVRTAAATGAFNVTVNTSLKSLTTAGTWTEVMSDGTTWRVIASGTL